MCTIPYAYPQSYFFSSLGPVSLGMAFSLNKIGPAAMVAAAFVGPGTLITCSIAGATFGYSLIWAVVFSVISTMVLQEMTGRLGVIKGLGLSESIRTMISNRWIRVIVSALSLIAILVGNAAYQSGNITGTVLGFSGIFDQNNNNSGLLTIWAMALLVSLLLFFGKYKVIERVLVLLVSLMSIIFIITAIALPVDLWSLMKGALIPSFPQNSFLLIMALIGTTVVPYNLFLHSSAVAQKWKGMENIDLVRSDVMISVGVGGLISVLIVVTSAATLHISGQEVTTLVDLGSQLKPILGDSATTIFSAGVFSAGLTSMITAPVAASYTVSGILGKSASFDGVVFRSSWLAVLWTGVIVASWGIQPLLLIQIAQFANGLILPVFGIFLLLIMNSKDLGNFRNGPISNSLGIIVILIVTLLGVRGILISLDMI